MKQGLHIGIILDGNRRFAKKERIRPWEGHKVGAQKVEQLVEWCRELGIREITLYTFSVENFKRARKEVEFLFRLFREQIKKLNESTNEKIQKNRIRVNFIGRLDMFPEDMTASMQEIMEKTKDYDSYILNFAMAYGGRTEIVDAMKKIANKVKRNEIRIEDINEKLVSENLYMADEPDMIIRPGGEKRVSNFLLWQGYYSEWYFCDKLWPEFTKEDLIKAIEELRSRQRRFGR